MMSKHILESTKKDFVTWFNAQSNDMQYQLMITHPRDKTQIARFRRLYLKTLNSINWQRVISTQPQPSRFREFVRKCEELGL
jgi:hypothetical protein